MKHSNTIRRFFAAFFLLLFSFCVTPKRFLHDLLANHKDALYSDSLPLQQISTSGFHCNVDDLVVVAPFLPGIQFNDQVILSSTPFNFSDPLLSVVYLYLSHNEGRGPPPVFCS
ncbi:MAG TPA: hypothetical protein VNW49_03145 [Puia sp.]|nr:hypothetical protein [Puia sp.]